MNTAGSSPSLRRWFPYYVFATALILTGLATFYYHKSAVLQERREFEKAAQQARERIRTRLEVYVALLRSGSGFLTAMPSMTREQFAAFVSRLRIGDFYPGVQGVGYTVRVRPGEREAFVRAGIAAGSPNFRIWPDYERAEYHAILFLEPPDQRNQVALGFDMFTEPVRRAAMERARDEASAAASGKVTLVQEISGPQQAGFLIYVPVYETADLPAAVEERRAQLRGFCYSPFRVDDLLNGVFQQYRGMSIDLDVYDGTEIAAEQLIHSSPRGVKPPARAFRSQFALDVAGRTWTLLFTSGHSFHQGHQLGSGLILLSGLIISGLIFSFTKLEAEAREEAVRTAGMLRESEERFRLMVDRAEDYAIIIMDPQGRISQWNPGAERILGYREPEIIGQPLSVLYPEEDRLAAVPERELKTAVESGKAADERWHLRKDQSRFWASGFAIALRDEAGHLRGFAKIMRDMTERKRAEEEVSKLNQTLEERVAQRTAALQESNEQMEAFTYTVAHDLRAPLRAMQGFSQALKEDYQEVIDDVGRDYIRRIINSAQRMDTLIQDLLSYSRLSRSNLTFDEVDLEQTVAAVVGPLKEELRAKGAEVDVVLPMPRARAHQPTLEHMISNLVWNALKFVEEGVPPRVRIFGEKRGGMVRLWVEDNGIGIAPEHHDRIFRVFERLYGSDSYPGTGIGLAIVRKGADRMGGSAGVESVVGQGSRFWIELPAHCETLH